MDQLEIKDIIDRYIATSHDVWKRGEYLVKEEIYENLTNDQLYLLRYIFQNGKCTTTELAEAFYVNKSAITAIISRLVEKKLVERSQDQDDRRIVYLTLTEDGRNLYLKMDAKVHKIVESFITQFDQQEISQFIKTYEKLANILKIMMEDQKE